MKKAALLFLIVLLAQIPAFADNSERINIYYNNGVTYYKEKKFSSAISEFKKVLRVNPYDAKVGKLLGTAYLSRAQYYRDVEKAYKKAINDFRSGIVYLNYWDEPAGEAVASAVQKAESDLSYLKRMYYPLKTADAINNEAKTLRMNGELAASIYEYRQLFNNSTYQANAYQTASDIYKSLNNEKMAIDCIRNAMNLKPKDGTIHFKYALLLDDIGNEDAAMDEYSKALENSSNSKDLLVQLQNLWMARSVKNPNDSQALINLGAVLQKQNMFELAKAQYLKARQINPNDPVILINLASVLTALNDYDNALKIYDEMLAKKPEDLSARFYKGQLYEKKGDIASAIKQYKEILSLKPNDANAQSAINNLLAGLNGDQLAGYLKTEADSAPGNYDAQFKYAFEMHKNKGYLAAIEYYKRAILADKNHPEPFINLAQIFILQEDYNKANAVIAHGLSVLPADKDLLELKSNLQKQNANNLYAKGTELYNNKDYSGALSYYSKIQYQTPEILSMIGNCYYELNQNERAVEFYKKALAQNKNDENAMLMLASALINQKKDAEAKVYLNNILTINPNNQDAMATLKALNEGEEGQMLDNAIDLYETKQYNEALAILDKLIAKNPKNAYAYYYRGAVRDEEKQTDLAILEYKKSISSDPNFSLSYYMLAVAYDTKENYKEAVSYYDKYIALKAKEGVDDEYTKYAKERVIELKNFLNQK